MNFHRSHPLHRNKKPLKRTPIKRVSSKRAKELREYSKRRLAFLAAHPWCQIWLAKRGIDETQIRNQDTGEIGWVCANGWTHSACCPRSTEVHHKNGRNGWRLLDESQWCAASHDEHAWVKENQAEARRIGVLV